MASARELHVYDLLRTNDSYSRLHTGPSLRPTTMSSLHQHGDTVCEIQVQCLEKQT